MILKYCLGLYTVKFYLKHLTVDTYMYRLKCYMTTSFTVTCVGHVEVL